MPKPKDVKPRTNQCAICGKSLGASELYVSLSDKIEHIRTCHPKETLQLHRLCELSEQISEFAEKCGISVNCLMRFKDYEGGEFHKYKVGDRVVLKVDGENPEEVGLILEVEDKVYLVEVDTNGDPQDGLIEIEESMIKSLSI